MPAKHRILAAAALPLIILSSETIISPAIDHSRWLDLRSSLRPIFVAQQSHAQIYNLEGCGGGEFRSSASRDVLRDGFSQLALQWLAGDSGCLDGSSQECNFEFLYDTHGVQDAVCVLAPIAFDMYSIVTTSQSQFPAVRILTMNQFLFFQWSDVLLTDWPVFALASHLARTLVHSGPQVDHLRDEADRQVLSSGADIRDIPCQNFIEWSFNVGLEFGRRFQSSHEDVEALYGPASEFLSQFSYDSVDDSTSEICTMAFATSTAIMTIYTARSQRILADAAIAGALAGVETAWRVIWSTLFMGGQRSYAMEMVVLRWTALLFYLVDLIGLANSAVRIQCCDEHSAHDFCAQCNADFVLTVLPWREEVSTNVRTFRAPGCAIAGSDDLWFSHMIDFVIGTIHRENRKVRIVDLDPALGQCVLPLIAAVGVEFFESVILVEALPAMRHALARTIADNGLQEVVHVVAAASSSGDAAIYAERRRNQTEEARCAGCEVREQMYYSVEAFHHSVAGSHVDVLISSRNTDLSSSSDVSCAGSEFFGAVRTDCRIGAALHHHEEQEIGSSSSSSSIPILEATDELDMVADLSKCGSWNDSNIAFPTLRGNSNVLAKLWFGLDAYAEYSDLPDGVQGMQDYCDELERSFPLEDLCPLMPVAVRIHTAVRSSNKISEEFLEAFSHALRRIRILTAVAWADVLKSAWPIFAMAAHLFRLVVDAKPGGVGSLVADDMNINFDHFTKFSTFFSIERNEDVACQNFMEWSFHKVGLEFQTLQRSFTDSEELFGPAAVFLARRFPNLLAADDIHVVSDVCQAAFATAFSIITVRKRRQVSAEASRAADEYSESFNLGMSEVLAMVDHIGFIWADLWSRHLTHHPSAPASFEMQMIILRWSALLFYLIDTIGLRSEIAVPCCKSTTHALCDVCNDGRYLHHIAPFREETSTTVMNVKALSCSATDTDDTYFGVMFSKIQSKLAEAGDKKITIVDVGPGFGQCILPLVATFGVDRFEMVILVEPTAVIRDILRRSVVYHSMERVVKIVPGIAHESDVGRRLNNDINNFDGNSAHIIPCQGGLVGSCMRVLPLNLAMPKILPVDQCDAHPDVSHAVETKFEEDFPPTRIQYSTCNMVAPPLPIYDLLAPLLVRNDGENITDIDFFSVFPTVNLGSRVDCVGNVNFLQDDAQDWH